MNDPTYAPLNVVGAPPAYRLTLPIPVIDFARFPSGRREVVSANNLELDEGNVLYFSKLLAEQMGRSGTSPGNCIVTGLSVRLHNRQPQNFLSNTFKMLAGDKADDRGADITGAQGDFFAFPTWAIRKGETVCDTESDGDGNMASKYLLSKTMDDGRFHRTWPNCHLRIGGPRECDVCIVAMERDSLLDILMEVFYVPNQTFIPVDAYPFKLNRDLLRYETDLSASPEPMQAHENVHYSDGMYWDVPITDRMTKSDLFVLRGVPQQMQAQMQLPTMYLAIPWEGEEVVGNNVNPRGPGARIAGGMPQLDLSFHGVTNLGTGMGVIKFGAPRNSQTPAYLLASLKKQRKILVDAEKRAKQKRTGKKYTKGLKGAKGTMGRQRLRDI